MWMIPIYFPPHSYKKELETMTQKIRIYSQDMRMEIGIEKYAMLIMKKKKRETME